MSKDKKIIKETEIKFWDFKYKDQNIDYEPNRDSYFHYHFKSPMFNLQKPAKILELACGVRTDGIELARAGHNLTELDISPEAVLKAKNLFESQNLSGKFIVGDAENLPFEGQSFDAVFTAASFHHFPNPLKTLQEIKRVTKPYGLIILGIEPNAWPYYTIYLILKPLQLLIRKINPRPFNSIADDKCWGFTKRKFKKLFKKAGIEIIEIKRVKYLQEFYDQWLRLKTRLIKETQQENPNMKKRLEKIDQVLSKIPILNLFNWHWNIIARRI